MGQEVLERARWEPGGVPRIPQRGPGPQFCNPFSELRPLHPRRRRPQVALYALTRDWARETLVLKPIQSSSTLLLWTAPVVRPLFLVSSCGFCSSRRVFLGSIQSSYVNKERISAQTLSLFLGLVTLAKSLPF